MSIRLGATSCVYGADIPANVEKLADRVDDIELVLFDVEAYGCNYPDKDTVRRLNDLAGEKDLSFTVHLEQDLGPALSLEKAKRIVSCTRDLNPFAYVAHLDGRALLGSPTAQDLGRWQDRAVEVLKDVCSLLDDPHDLCIENVEAWDSAAFAPVVETFPVSRCIDVGHLWLQGEDPMEHISAWVERTRVVHIHGVNGQDHQSLVHAHPGELALISDLLEKRFEGVVTLEVFSEKDLLSSMDAWIAAYSV